MCELCDIIPDKEKKGRIMAKKCFVLHEEVIDFFHRFLFIPTIEKLSFHLYHVRILDSMECGRKRYDCFLDNSLKKFRLKKEKESDRYRNTESKFGWKYTIINGTYCC